MDFQVESISVLLVSYKPFEVFLSFEDPSGYLLHDFQLVVLHSAELLKGIWKFKAHRKVCSKKCLLSVSGLFWFFGCCCFGLFCVNYLVAMSFLKEILPCIVLWLPEKKTCDNICLFSFVAS